LHDPHLDAQRLKEPVANSRANSSGFLATIDNEYAVHDLLRALLFADWPKRPTPGSLLDPKGPTEGGHHRTLTIHSDGTTL